LAIFVSGIFSKIIVRAKVYIMSEKTTRYIAQGIKIGLWVFTIAVFNSGKLFIFPVYYRKKFLFQNYCGNFVFLLGFNCCL